MFRNRCTVVAVVVGFTCLAGLGAQAPQDDESVWRAFMVWFRTAPPTPGSPLGAYRRVAAGGQDAGGEVTRRLDVLMRMVRQRSDWVETVSTTWSSPGC